MKNLKFYEQLKAVPQDALKKIEGGRLSGKTDINPQWRIEVMTTIFGPVGIGWYFVPIKKWIEEGANGEKCGFVDIELYVNIDGEWSKPIYGTGGASFVAKEKNGYYTSDEVYKMATTDALSTSMKMLGVAADVYRGVYDSKYQKNTGSKAAEEPQKPWLNMADKQGNILKTYEKVILAAKEKGLKTSDLEQYYRISKEVKQQLEKEL